MSGTDIAVVVTAVGTAVTAVGGLVLAVGVLVPILRNTRKAVATTAEVHTMVNQQRTDMLRYQVALVDALRSAGIDVPTDQSLGIAPPPKEG
jgi:uncharacterized Ntn-hydrolase superfamily protein